DQPPVLPATPFGDRSGRRLACFRGRLWSKSRRTHGDRFGGVGRQRVRDGEDLGRGGGDGLRRRRGLRGCESPFERAAHLLGGGVAFGRIPRERAFDHLGDRRRHVAADRSQGRRNFGQPLHRNRD